MKKQETLRPKFYYGRDIALSFDDKATVYAIGFYAGQMEKVVSGACRYCMFLPEKKDFSKIEGPLLNLAERFGLEVRLYGNEFWICRPGNEEEYHQMCELEPDSSEFHVLRAKMCGIHSDFIDPEYHRRDGHNEYKKT